MKITLLPKTNLDKWTVIAMIASAVLFLAGSVLPYKTGYSGLEMIMQNPLQALITILLLAVGLAALILGLISITKKHERSILVFLAVLLGLQSVLGFIGAVANVFFS